MDMIRRKKFFRSSRHWTTVLNFVRLRSADVWSRAGSRYKSSIKE